MELEQQQFTELEPEPSTYMYVSDELDVALAQLHRPYYIRMGPSCEALYCGHVPSIQYPTSLGGGTSIKVFSIILCRVPLCW